MMNECVACVKHACQQQNDHKYWKLTSPLHTCGTGGGVQWLDDQPALEEGHIVGTEIFETTKWITSILIRTYVIHEWSSVLKYIPLTMEESFMKSLRYLMSDTFPGRWHGKQTSNISATTTQAIIIHMQVARLLWDRPGCSPVGTGHDKMLMVSCEKAKVSKYIHTNNSAGLCRKMCSFVDINFNTQTTIIVCLLALYEHTITYL